MERDVLQRLVWSSLRVSWGHRSFWELFVEKLADPLKSLSHSLSLSLPGVQHMPGSVGAGKENVDQLTPWEGGPGSEGETHWCVANGNRKAGEGG